MTLGPEDAADAIKRALQMGASAGIHIIDDAVHGSDALASTVLAEGGQEGRTRSGDLRHGLHRRHHGRDSGHDRRAARLARCDLGATLSVRTTA